MKLLLLELLLLSALVAFGLTLRPLSSQPAELLQRVNQKRESMGLTALVTTTLLAEVAQAHSSDMAARDYLAHGSPEGLHGNHRLAKAGYQYIYWGEVIAGGVDTPGEALNGWLSSPAHRKVLLDGRYSEAGLGFAVGPNSKYRYYWVIVLAKPKD